MLSVRTNVNQLVQKVKPTVNKMEARTDSQSFHLKSGVEPPLYRLPFKFTVH